MAIKIVESKTPDELNTLLQLLQNKGIQGFVEQQQPSTNSSLEWALNLIEEKDIPLAIKTIQNHFDEKAKTIKENNQNAWVQSSRGSIEEDLKFNLNDFEHEFGELEKASANLFGDVSNNFLSRSGPLTKVVLGICAIVYLVMQTETNYNFSQYLFFFGFQLTPFSDPAPYWQFWRIIGPIFLHFSMAHLIFNGLWWFELGGRIEEKESVVKLGLIVIFSAIASNSGQFLLTGPNFGGLSGVVYALLAYHWTYNQSAGKTVYNISKNIVIVMVIWMLIGVLGLLDNIIGPMANAAHAIGLLTGIILGLLGGLNVRKPN